MSKETSSISERTTNYERCMVSILVDTIDEKGLKHIVVAEQAWPDLTSAGTGWRRARNSRKGEAPRKMPLRDLIAMAEVLGLNFIQLCAEVELKIKNGWNYKKDDTSIVG